MYRNIIFKIQNMDDNLFLLKITRIISFRIHDIANISIIHSISYMIKFYIPLYICVCVLLCMRFWKFMNTKELREKLQRQFLMIENFRDHRLDNEFFPLENIKKQNVLIHQRCRKYEKFNKFTHLSISEIIENIDFINNK